MNAFVLSGGGSLGALQAGMLEALLEAGIEPHALVGTSIGAANAAFMAADPSLDRARELSEVWRSVRAKKLFPIGLWRTARAFARDGALFDPRPLADLVERSTGYGTLENAAVPLRIVATSFEDGAEVVFDTGAVSDAVLASTALPGVFPPHAIGERLFLDGGLVDHVPIAPALALGADTIYVLSCGFPCPPSVDRRSVRSIVTHSIGILLSQRVRLDIDQIPAARPDVKVISIPPVCTRAGLRDLGRAAELIDKAREQTALFLSGARCPTCPHHHGTPDAKEVTIGDVAAVA